MRKLVVVNESLCRRHLIVPGLVWGSMSHRNWSQVQYT